MYTKDWSKRLVEPTANIRVLKEFDLEVEWNKNVLREQLKELVEEAPSAIE